MRKVITYVVFISLVVGISAVYTAEFAVSLESAGQLIWSNLSPYTESYQVEWAANLEGPWTNNWAGMDNIPATQSSYCVDVPMFYRVRAIVTNTDYHAADYGAPNASTITQCLNDIGSEAATLILDDSDWDIDADVTIPTNVQLQIESGSVVYIDPLYSLNIQSEFDAPLSQIFGTRSITQSISDWREKCRVRFAKLKYDWVYPEWFGADPTDNNPDTLAVNFAADAYPRIYFNAGTWLFNNTLLLTNDNVYIKGAGMGNTVLQYDDDIVGFDGHDATDLDYMEITSRHFLVTSRYLDSGYVDEGVDNAVVEDITFDCSYKKLYDLGYTHVTPQACIIRGDGPRATRVEVKNFGAYGFEGFAFVMSPWCAKDTNTIIFEEGLIHSAQYPEVWGSPSLVTVLDIRGSFSSHQIANPWEYSTESTQSCHVLIRNNLFRDIDLYDETNDVKRSSVKLCDGATLYENNMVTNSPMVTAFGGSDTGMYDEPIIIRSNKVYSGCFNAVGAIRDQFGLRAWGGFIIEDNYFEVSPPSTTNEILGIAYYASGSWPQCEATNRSSIWGDLIIRNNIIKNLSTNHSTCWGIRLMASPNINDLFSDERTWFSGLEIVSNNLENCEIRIWQAPGMFNSNSLIADNYCQFNEYGAYSNFSDYSTGKVIPFTQAIENSDWYENPATSTRYRAVTNNTFPYSWGYPPSYTGSGSGFPCTRFFYESINTPGTSNYITDPSMNSGGTCGWTRQSMDGTNGVEFTASTDFAYRGSQSLKVTMLQDYEMYTNNPAYLRNVRKVLDGMPRFSNIVAGCYIYPTTTNITCSIQVIPRFDGSTRWSDPYSTISPDFVLQTGQWNHVQMCANWWQFLESVNPARIWTNCPNGYLVQINCVNDQFHPLSSNDVIYVDNVYLKSGTDLSPIICSE